MSGTERAADAALHAQFRVHYLRVNALCQQLLQDDLQALAYEEDLTLEQAAFVLNRRVGGGKRLGPYAACLLAQHDRHQKGVQL